MTDHTHAFKATIDIYDFWPYFYTVIYIPAEVKRKLPLEEYPRLRVEAVIDDYPAKGALIPDRIGSKQTEHLLAKGYEEGTRIWYPQTPKKAAPEYAQKYW